MGTIVTLNKKEDIELDEKTINSLNDMAIKEGKDLKGYIESLLEEKVEEYEDSLLYSYLCKTKPDGKKILTGDEKRKFEEWLGI